VSGPSEAKPPPVTVRDLLVEVVVRLRSEYLIGPGKTRVLDHWDDLQNALRRSVQGVLTPEEMLTKLRAKLRLGAAPASSLACLTALVDETREESSARQLFDMIRREHALVIALAHVQCDEAREARRTA